MLAACTHLQYVTGACFPGHSGLRPEHGVSAHAPPHQHVPFRCSWGLDMQRGGGCEMECFESHYGGSDSNILVGVWQLHRNSM